MTRILKISNGTSFVEFVDKTTTGYLNLVSFKASTGEYKGGGIFQSSPLVTGRRLVSKTRSDIVDSWEFSITEATSQDAAWTALATLIALLEQASDYWTDPRQKNPVWIERKTDSETSKLYAHIVTGRVADIPDVYGPEFGQKAILNMTLTVEHKNWQSTQPGQAGTPVPLALYLHRYIGDYEAKVLAATPAPLVMWPLDDTSGTTVTNTTGAGYNGVYNDGDLNEDEFVDGSPVPFIGDGVSFPSTAAIDIHTASLTAGWDQALGSMMLWVKGNAAAAGLTTPLFHLYIDASNYIYVWYSYDDEQVTFTHMGSGVERTAVIDGITFQGWTAVTITWDEAEDIVRCYINSALMAEMNRLGAMTGTLAEATVASDAARDYAAYAYVANAILWDEALTAVQVGEFVNLGLNQTASSAEDIYIVNGSSAFNLSIIFVYDASAATYSANQAHNDSGFSLFPATPAVGDYTLFARYSGIPGGFNNLIFTIDTPASGVSYVWEYWNGAWVGLDENEVYPAFDYTGPGSVHWDMPLDWATKTENGFTTYWVRARVTAVSSPVSPTQDTAYVYCQRVPYVEILANEIDGDIPALARIRLRNQSGWRDEGGLGTPPLITNRVIVGLRSFDGYTYFDRFNAFINLSDTGNQPGITIVAENAAAFENSILAPTGRRIIWNPGSPTALGLIVSISMFADVAASYRGRFHAYLRCSPAGAGAAAGSMGAQLRVYGVDRNVPTYTSEIAYTDAASSFRLLDMGEVVIGEDFRHDELQVSMLMEIYAVNTQNSPYFRMFDLILMPIDEWFADFTDKDNSHQSALSRRPGNYATLLDIDGISYPKGGLCRSVVKSSTALAGNTIHSVWRKQTINGEPILKTTRKQRLWFLCGYMDTSLTDIYWAPGIAHTVQVEKSERYVIHRGNR